MLLYGNRSFQNFITSLLQVKGISGLDEIGTCVAFQIKLKGFNCEEYLYINTSFVFLVALCYVVVEATN